MSGTHDNGTGKKESNIGTLTAIHGGIYKPQYPIKRGHARRDTENQTQRPAYDTP